MVTMRLSGTVTEIWRLKDNGVTSLTFWGHVTSRLPGVDFLWAVHSDHASTLHRYGNMTPQILDGFCFCPYPLQTPVKDITQSGVVMPPRCWEEDLGRQLTPN